MAALMMSASSLPYLPSGSLFVVDPAWPVQTALFSSDPSPRLQSSLEQAREESRLRPQLPLLQPPPMPPDRWSWISTDVSADDKQGAGK